MDWLSSRIFKVISFVVLFFFTWTSGGLFEIALAISNSSELGVESSELKTQKPEEKLQKALEEIERVLTDTSTDTKTKKNKLGSKKLELGTIDTDIKKQFKETEEKIKDLPDEILQRHKDFVKHYDDNLKELNANLDAIDKAKTETEINTQIEKTKAFLEKVKPPKKHTPLDPNNLPHRTAEPEWIEPRLTPEEFQQEQGQVARVKGGFEKPILVASASDSLNGILSDNSKYTSTSVIPVETGIQGSGNPIETFGYDKGSSSSSVFDFNSTNSQLSTPNLLLAATTPPSPADLSETIEVQFTPEITAKAEELQHNPVKIYNWVRNNIEFVPIYGSIQGANMCLQTKLCNAFDTASLLIALLRVSGISAKYVQGTVEIPIDKVMNWVGGFTDPNAALTLIASGGIPGAIRTSGGQIVAAHMEHVWVEAYVPYGNYRGLMRDDSIKAWIPMDGSFKQYEYIQGIDIQNATGVDPLDFHNQLNSLVTVDPASGGLTNIDIAGIETQLINLQGNLTNYLDNNMPDSMLKEIIGGRTIKDLNFTLLPSTLPYKILATLDKYSEIPSNYRYKIAIHMTDDNGNMLMSVITKSLPELSGQRITISYNPATDSDADILRNYSTDGVQSLPAYLINLAPALSVEGVEVARGTHVKMGSLATINVKFIKPGGAYDWTSHDLTDTKLS